MSTMLRVCLSATLVISLCGVSPADEPQLDGFKSAAARKAVVEYRRKLGAAEKEFQQTALEQTKKLIEELEKALRKATDDRALDEGVRIKAAIAALKTTLPQPTRRGVGALLGFWRVQFSTGTIRYQKFVRRGNGFYTYCYKSDRAGEKPTHQGPAKFQGDKVIVTFAGNEFLERYNTDGGRLYIESWHLVKNDSVDRFADVLGIGARFDAK